MVVGFSGGVAALASSGLPSLENRLYKWDNAVGSTGVKTQSNLIRGSVFSRIIDEMKVNSSLSPMLNPTTKRSSNWEGTHNFSGMFNLCLEHGDNIIIGFAGGRDEFARKSLSELQKRPSYKWDFAEHTAGKKLSDWLPGATVITILKSHHGYSGNRK